LHGPGARAHGVDLERMLVIQPPAAELARVAARVVSSRIFAAVVIDTTGILGARVDTSLAAWATAVRRIALAAEGCDTAVLLLTDRDAARPLPLPVALRLELSQTGPDKLSVRIAKERRGHVRDAHELSVARTIPAVSPLTLSARKAG
jgi:recombination protein RecA